MPRRIRTNSGPRSRNADPDDSAAASRETLRIHLPAAVFCCTIRFMAASRRRPGRPQLDDISKAIIEQLQADGRRPYASIGKAVGLSEAAVRQRVQKLVDSGAMQIVAVDDPRQVGFARPARVWLTVSGARGAVYRGGGPAPPGVGLPHKAMIAISVSGDLEDAAAQLSAITEVEYLVI